MKFWYVDLQIKKNNINIKFLVTISNTGTIALLNMYHWIQIFFYIWSIAVILLGRDNCIQIS